MTGWLLDTNVLSIFAPGKPTVEPNVAAWFEKHTDDLFLSAVTAAEIEAGISKLRRTHCDQDIVTAAHAAQEVAVLDAGPAASDYSVDSMAAEQWGETYRQLLVKKDTHRPGAPRGRGRARQWLVRASQMGIGEEPRQECHHPPGSRIAI